MKSERKLANSFHRVPQFDNALQEEASYKPVSVGLERAAQQYILSPFYIRNYDTEMYAADYRSEVIQTQIMGGQGSVPPLPGGAEPAGPRGPPGPSGPRWGCRRPRTTREPRPGGKSRPDGG